MSELTPMLRQYLEIKSQQPDAVLFFRMGDFYEMFFDDAEVASRVLGITLTARGTYRGRKVPMCGVPHHAAKGYIGRMVQNGFKVAICEQMEDPRTAKGIVQREVQRVVTSGSAVDEGFVDESSNLYMAAVCEGRKVFGLSCIDLSTGEYKVTEVEHLASLLDELNRIAPAELLITEKLAQTHARAFGRYPLELRGAFFEDAARAEALLKEQLQVQSLAGFGCQGLEQGLIAAGALVQYLKETQRACPQHVSTITPYRLGDFMFLDEATTTHLELLKSWRRGAARGSLYHVLNRTVTSMGARLLKRFILYPLLDLAAIHKRLAAVAWFREDHLLREQLRSELSQIADLERLNARVAMGRANARDLLALKHSVRHLKAIKARLTDAASTLLAEIALQLDLLEDVAAAIEEAINEDPPLGLKEGGLIKEGFDAPLDRLIQITRQGKQWIAEFAATEQARTGIPNLKVGFNKVFGYYIEISKGQLDRVPEDYYRKQTLVNAERFITPGLKEREEEVLGAEEKRCRLEYALFEEIRARVAGEQARIRAAAERIALVDVLAGLAEVAQLNNYVCPEVNDGLAIEIAEGRHPVVEQTFKEEAFVPNDIHLDSSDQQVIILTGPNMAGKSTILRQTALTVLMAQIGSFVPATRACIGLVDRIFTRVGASDDLSQGQSTFMVEMNETANILRHATPRSLVVLDEIGRGTSTYDGLSIAWAVAEALHDRNDAGVRTLFATHYHELTELAATKCRVRNFNIAVREWDDQIIFLRRLVPGGTNRSYGIQVARIAGIPEDVLRRATEVLEGLEKAPVPAYGGGGRRDNTGGRLPKVGDPAQMSLFSSLDGRLTEWLQQLEPAGMTPLDALLELDRMKKFVCGNG